jgi:Na+/H+ antiporter NhaD/arsenite permease-like protein
MAPVAQAARDVILVACDKREAVTAAVEHGIRSHVSPRNARRRHAPAMALAMVASSIAGVAAGDTGASVSPPGFALAWAIPFAGLIISIATLPLLAPKLWHGHYGRIAAAWTLAFVVPASIAYGWAALAPLVAHAIFAEYVPFIAVLLALFSVAGGICIRGGLRGEPLHNTALLAVGTALASVMGTTGAAMLLIRPLLTANASRPHIVHVVVFFIILVGNVGGALSPLGDPPLFIGFLKGVDFFWTTRHLLVATTVIATPLLVAFYALDAYLLRREAPHGTVARERFSVEGKANFALLAVVVGAVLMTGLWRPGIVVHIIATSVALPQIVCVALLLIVTAISLAVTPRSARQHNAFTWAPILEVAKLFAAIFVTIVPVIAMLQAGRSGPLAALVALAVDASGAPRNAVFFWMTGTLSSFLDNAPTYLVFFNLAGGDAGVLVGPRQSTLAAISSAAVYFGALTYIGNAPNFLVKTIAEERGVNMPNFFGYLAYAALILLPLLAVVSWMLA